MTTTKVFGYGRVSSEDQNEARQMAAFKALGIAERDIYIDKQSGKDFDRKAYQAVKAQLRAGDTLYVKELDRLGRDAEGIKREWQEIRELGAFIVIMDMPILDTRPREYAIGDMEQVISNIVLELLSYMAQKERERIRKRQREGIDAAQARGDHLGRPQAEITDTYRLAYAKWKNGEITAVQAMKEADCTKTTFYKLAKQMDGE